MHQEEHAGAAPDPCKSTEPVECFLVPDATVPREHPREVVQQDETVRFRHLPSLHVVLGQALVPALEILLGHEGDVLLELDHEAGCVVRRRPHGIPEELRVIERVEVVQGLAEPDRVDAVDLDAAGGDAFEQLDHGRLDGVPIGAHEPAARVEIEHQRRLNHALTLVDRDLLPDRRGRVGHGNSGGRVHSLEHHVAHEAHGAGDTLDRTASEPTGHPFGWWLGRRAKDLGPAEIAAAQCLAYTALPLVVRPPLRVHQPRVPVRLALTQVDPVLRQIRGGPVENRLGHLEPFRFEQWHLRIADRVREPSGHVRPRSSGPGSRGTLLPHLHETDLVVRESRGEILQHLLGRGDLGLEVPLDTSAFAPHVWIERNEPVILTDDEIHPVGCHEFGVGRRLRRRDMTKGGRHAAPEIHNEQVYRYDATLAHCALRRLRLCTAFFRESPATRERSC